MEGKRTMVKLSHILLFALMLLVASLLLFAVSQRIYGEMAGTRDITNSQGETERQRVQTYTLW